MMKLIIHRGAKEIGGSCVELISENSRILIDPGMPLVARSGKPFDGILISHAHLDHYGFLYHVHQDIPVFMSRGAKELIDITRIFVTKKPSSPGVKIIKHLRPFRVGDFNVTPYLVDHSAFDALAFLVEADGKRVFYSGDFRGHGRKSVLFDRMVKDPPSGVECLLMEGSMIGRGEEVYPEEKAVQGRIEVILKGSDNITFFFASSQNIDRIVSAYKACLRTGRIFVIDIYTAFVLDKLRKVSGNIPQFDWKNIRVKFTKHHADTLADAGYRELLYVYNKRKIDMFEINHNKRRILMLGRDNSIFPDIIKNIEGPAGAKVIYSMWEGYLTDRFKEYCAGKGLVIEQVHTGPHATIEDLKTFADAIKPGVLVPIHTFNPEKYTELFGNVKTLNDGEIYDIA